MAEQSFHIVFALFPGVTQLDFTGPHQVFSRWPGARITLASAAGGAITADGITFANLARLRDVASCDLICVPGGEGVTEAILHDEFMREIARLARSAQFVTSVCSGSLALGAAGLLQGKRAACHWAWRDLLLPFGAIVDEARVVRDGNIVTGGGVTAGVDFALAIIGMVSGQAAAEEVQLRIEYAPAPPHHAGRPEMAPVAVVSAVKARILATQPKRLKAVQQAAQRLKAAAT